MADRRIRRGDIFYAALSPVTGSEQGGYRPVLIIQNDIGNEHSPTVIVAAITRNPKTKLPTHVPIQEMRGLKPDSVVLLEQIRTLDKNRLEEYVGRVDWRQMKKIEEALRISAGIEKVDGSIRIDLCPMCAKIFYESENHFIKRAYIHQENRENCMLCKKPLAASYFIRQKYKCEYESI